MGRRQHVDGDGAAPENSDGVERRPSLLLVTRNLPPMIGGMERLVWHIVDELSLDWRVHVIGPMGCRALLPAVVSSDEVPPSPLPLFLLRSSALAWRAARRNRPQRVFAGSGLTAPVAWLAARTCGSRCLVYLHGLDIDTNHWLYRLIWRPFIRHCDMIIVNSNFTRQLAQDARVPAGRMALLHPGMTMPSLDDAASAAARFRTDRQLGDAPLMLYVGRITARKGLLKFLREVLPRVLQECPGARMLVIGDEPHGAVLRADAGEAARCEQVLLENGLGDAVGFLGEVDDDRLLSSAYFAADVSVFPITVRPHDNEGFGMVAIEAAAHGCPTVAYRAGGVADAVAEGVSGMLVSPGDAVAFAEAVLSFLSSRKREVSTESCREFAGDFRWSRFGEKLRALVRGVAS